MTLRQQYQELYWCWKAIKQRCLNPKAQAYRNYGARGITICDEWMDFEPFLSWALDAGWQKGLDLDRVNNDEGYTPENCRFITRRDNVNNRRNTTLITVNGITHPSTVWADTIGAGHGTVKSWVVTRGVDYAADRIAEALDNGYVKRDYRRNHKMFPVVHVESGQRFDSIRQAARHFGINSGQLNNAIKYGHNTRAGHFQLQGVMQ